MDIKKYSAIIIGSGFSGLAIAIKLKERGIHDILILEKEADMGGTWRDNTYPGAECDIPSALYSYSFEPYPHWQYKWSMQPQILEYIKYVADKYDITPHIQFQKEMTSAQWVEDKSLWEVSTKDGSNYYTKNLITAIGQLHHPKVPNLQGKDLYKGDYWHSANWNHNVSLEDKTVGVIGNAASAVQFIPEIANTAKRVIVFQRSANWMLPKQDRAYKDWEKKMVAKFPLLLKIYRLRLWMLGGSLFFLMKNGNQLLRKIYQNKSIKFIQKHISDPKIVQDLTPTYPMGAKRVLFSDNYYAAVAQSNVDLVNNGIAQITPEGVQTKDGNEHSVDVLVYATGFKTNPFLLGLDITGRNGLTIREYWKEEPKNYLGMTMNGFPNFFMMYGPNTNLGHNSIIIMSEAQANYIVQVVQAMNEQQWNEVEIKESALEDYHRSAQERLKNMIWSQVEDSWYRSENGKIPNNYPGRTMEYLRVTKTPNFDDYNVA